MADARSKTGGPVDAAHAGWRCEKAAVNLFAAALAFQAEMLINTGPRGRQGTPWQLSQQAWMTMMIAGCITPLAELGTRRQDCRPKQLADSCSCLQRADHAARLRGATPVDLPESQPAFAAGRPCRPQTPPPKQCSCGCAACGKGHRAHSQAASTRAPGPRLHLH